VELSDYLKTLAKHWVAILILAVLGAAAGYGIARITPPSYRAQASVLVYSQKGDNTSELVQGSTFAQNMVTSYAALATTPAVLTPAIESLGLDTTAQDLARSVTADVPLNTVIIQIGVTGTSAPDVARTADAIATSLGEVVHTLSPKGLKGASTVTAQPVAPAPVPSHPYAPNANLMIGTGLAAGLALGIIFALIRGLRIQRVRPLKDAAAHPTNHADTVRRSHDPAMTTAAGATAVLASEAISESGIVAKASSASDIAESDDDSEADPAGDAPSKGTSPHDGSVHQTETKPERTLHVVDADDEYPEESGADAPRPKTAR
jgi:capsular polysaccharide biosynthesis protein